MTYAEFCIRSFCYHRREQAEWSKFRKVAYMALIAPSYNYKKLPKKESTFLPLPLVDKKPMRSNEINPKILSNFMAEAKEFYSRLKNKPNE